MCPDIPIILVQITKDWWSSIYWIEIITGLSQLLVSPFPCSFLFLLSSSVILPHDHRGNYYNYWTQMNISYENIHWGIYKQVYICVCVAFVYLSIRGHCWAVFPSPNDKYISQRFYRVYRIRLDYSSLVYVVIITVFLWLQLQQDM